MKNKLTDWDIKLIIVHAILIFGILVAMIFSALTLSRTYDLLFGVPKPKVETIYPEIIK